MINYVRRATLAAFGILVTPLAAAWSSMSSNLEIILSVIDEQGNPIPYASVWGYVLPSAAPLALDGEDLLRLTNRYQSSIEFVTPFHRIVPKLLVFPMGDAEGRARAVIDYSYLEGAGRERPAAMQIGFTVTQRGYFSGRVDFKVTNESRCSIKVVLKRDLSQSVETQPYLKEFLRIRYELSDTSRNAKISGEAYRRVEGLRQALEVAANQALAAGDKSAAARIYARMQYLPVIQMQNGKVVGFMQVDQYSEQSWAYLVKAYELDPGNPYIAAKYTFRYGATEFGGNKYLPDQASDERAHAFEVFLSQLHMLMKRSGAQIWPEYHELYALWHRKSREPGERAKMIPLLKELYQLEPKLETKEQMLQTLSM